MTPHERAAMLSRFEKLADVLGYELTPTRVEGYMAALDDLDYADVVGALSQALRVCKFFPKPAELREFVAASQHQRDVAEDEACAVLRRADEQRRLEAWDEDLKQREAQREAENAKYAAEHAETEEQQAARLARSEAAFQEFRTAMCAMGRRHAWPGSTSS